LKIISAWFGKRNRGFFMGIWSGCASIGNIVGYIIGYICLNLYKLDWPSAIAITCAYYLFTALICMVFLKSKPLYIDCD
jgi:OPA family glycerol-3-phosphate transporter-like MFS transporter 3